MPWKRIIQFSRGLGNQKVGKPKKPRENKKKQKKNNFPEVLVDRGVQPRVPKYCVFFVFPRFF